MKPIAWIAVGDNTSVFFDLDCALAIDENPTPLYTHPSKTEDEGKVCARCGAIAYDPVITQTAKTLTDEEWNKAFDCYCETDEGVLKFDLELRDEWKKEQLIRWKEALRKAQENV